MKIKLHRIRYSDARGRTDYIKKMANEISNAINEQKSSTREESITDTVRIACPHIVRGQF